MPIKTRYILCRESTCTLGEWFDHLAQHGNTNLPPALQLQDVCALIRNLAFIVEVTPGLKDGVTAKRVLAESDTMLKALEG